MIKNIRFRLSFYANKEGCYYNQRFNFDCSSESVAFSWLILFKENKNHFNKIYITDLCTKDNLTLDSETLSLFNSDIKWIIAAKANLH